MTAARYRGFVVSDLHMFARRCVADIYIPDIRRAAAGSSFLVLNGDIVDFRWTTLPTVEATVDAAIDWLADLVTNFPKCRIHYVLGNHDALEAFAERLESLALHAANFAFYTSHVRIGNALFLHGDMAFPPRQARTILRPLHRQIRRRRMPSRKLYHGIVVIGAHKSASLLHSRRFWIRRILSFLNRTLGAVPEGITDVYFGHTHVPFADYEHNGIRFHNTGAAIKGLQMDLRELELSSCKGTSE